MTEKHLTENEPGTLEIARTIGSGLTPGAVVALTGDLGAGKTVFAQGIAESLGVRDKVTSPTFTLINEYRGTVPVYHMDLYRLDTTEEIENIGIVDYLYGEGVCIIEWAEKLKSLMPESVLSVSLRQLGVNRREITIERSDTNE